MTHKLDASLIMKRSISQRWLPVPGYPDYEISNDGRLRRATDCQCRKARAPLRCDLTGRGYPTYRLTAPDGDRKRFGAHVLVAMAFRPDAVGPFVLHGDDDKLNCTFENVRRGTHLDNMADARENGRLPRGPTHHNSARPWHCARGDRIAKKLTKEAARQIYFDRRTHDAIAAEYGVAQSTVTKIKQLKAWRQVNDSAYAKTLSVGEAAR